MKEQADIAQKAGYHRHDDTLPLFLRMALTYVWSYAARAEVVHTVFRQVHLSW